MDDFNESKKDILHCLSIVAGDVIDLPNYPLQVKTDLIINELFEIMIKLRKMSNNK